MTSVEFSSIISPTFLRDSNVFLVILLVTIIFSLWHAFSVIYHLIRFGIGTIPKKIAMVFLSGTMLFMIISVIMYVRTIWLL